MNININKIVNVLDVLILKSINLIQRKHQEDYQDYQEYQDQLIIDRKRKMKSIILTSNLNKKNSINYQSIETIFIKI